MYFPISGFYLTPGRVQTGSDRMVHLSQPPNIPANLVNPEIGVTNKGGEQTNNL